MSTKSSSILATSKREFVNENGEARDPRCEYCIHMDKKYKWLSPKHLKASMKLYNKWVDKCGECLGRNRPCSLDKRPKITPRAPKRKATKPTEALAEDSKYEAVKHEDAKPVEATKPVEAAKSSEPPNCGSSKSVKAEPSEDEPSEAEPSEASEAPKICVEVSK